MRYVFTRSYIREGWLNFIKYYVRELDAPNVESFQLFNELSYHSWSMDVSHSEFYQMSLQTYQAAKSVTSKPITVRYSCDGTNGIDERIYDLFDYFCVNYYNTYSTPSQLRSIVSDVNSHGKELWVTEYGSSSTNDYTQARIYEENLELFEDAGVSTAVNWWWSGQTGVGNTNYNVAEGAGDPKPAFDVILKYDIR
jgi:hypothetical protein